MFSNLDKYKTLEGYKDSPIIEYNTLYETYKKSWEAAAQAQSDAQDAMLSKTEEWAEAQRAIVENELADLIQLGGDHTDPALDIIAEDELENKIEFIEVKRQANWWNRF